MDATPPAAAGSASRPPSSSEIPLMLRRLAIGLAGLAVAVLAGAACALSFDDLRALAIAGQAKPRLAYLYPAGFDALLIVALISVPLLRSARLLVRIQAGLILTVLLASVATATVAAASGVTFDIRQAAIVVALLPWVMLVVALWLLLVLMKHAQARRADLDGVNDAGEIVPFDGDGDEPEADPSPATRASSTDDGPGVPTDPYPVLGHTSRRGRPASTPAPVREAPAPPDLTSPEPTQPDSTTSPEPIRPDSTRPLAASAASEAVAPRPEPTPPQEATASQEVTPPAEAASPPRRARPRVQRPVRWGDLVRPHTGDVLVHPSPKQAPPTTAQDAAERPAEDARSATENASSQAVASEGASAEEAQSAAEDSTSSDATSEIVTPDEAHGSAEDSTSSDMTSEIVTPGEAHDSAEDLISHDVAAEDATVAGVTVEDVTVEDVTVEDVDEETVMVVGEEAPDGTESPDSAGPLVAASDEASTEPSGPHGGAAEENAERFSQRARQGESEVDTQPLRQIPNAPDPAHAPDAADPEEESAARRQPYDAGADEDSAPPSGRMRSTPRPPS